MTGFSYGQAVGAGFRVLGRTPWAVLAWAGAYLLMVALPSYLLIAQALPDMITTYRDAAQAAVGGAPPNLERVLALRSKLAITQPLLFVLHIVSRAILMGAVYRAVLEPDAKAWGYLRLSKQELWLGLTYLVFAVMGVILVLTLMVPLSIAAAIGEMSARHGGGNPIEVLLLVLIFLAGIGAIIWLMLRLSLALPASWAQGRFVLYESWTLTRDQGFKLFLVGLTLLAIVGIIDLAAWLGAWTLILNHLVGAGSWRAALHSSASELAQRLLPIIIGVGVVGSVFGMAIYAVVVAPWAEMYRQLSANAEADKSA